MENQLTGITDEILKMNGIEKLSSIVEGPKVIIYFLDGNVGKVEGVDKIQAFVDKLCIRKVTVTSESFDGSKGIASVEIDLRDNDITKLSDVVKKSIDYLPKFNWDDLVEKSQFGKVTEIPIILEKDFKLPVK